MNLAWVIIVVVTTLTTLAKAPHVRTTLTATSSLQEVDSEIQRVWKVPPDVAPGMKPFSMSHKEALELSLKLLEIRSVVERSRAIPEADRKEKEAEINTHLVQLKAF